MKRERDIERVLKPCVPKYDFLHLSVTRIFTLYVLSKLGRKNFVLFSKIIVNVAKSTFIEVLHFRLRFHLAEALMKSMISVKNPKL